MNDQSQDKTVFELPVYSNCTALIDDKRKVELRFPDNGFLQLSENYKFDSREELSKFICSVFPTNDNRPGFGGTIRRVGKYQRVDGDGNPIFTFGDPVLDLITNERGIIFIGGEPFDLQSFVLSNAGIRHGGISSIDLAPYVEKLQGELMTAAVLGKGNYALVESGEELTILASTNPKRRLHYAIADGGKSSILLVFEAWRTSLFFYWSMGAYVESWLSNFDEASVGSRYGNRSLVSNCVEAILRYGSDFDRDTNDNYVDEIEWGTTPTSPFDAVQSLCYASWKGRSFSGCVSVEEGCTFELPCY